MSGKMPTKRDSVVGNLKDKLDGARLQLEQRDGVIRAQQQELEQLRAEAIDKQRRRPFRKRRIEHGPLTIMISPADDDVTQDEVRIEQVGDSLLILVGNDVNSARAIEPHAIVVAPARSIEPKEIARPARSGEVARGKQEEALEEIGVNGGIKELFTGAQDPRLLSLASGEPNATITGEGESHYQLEDQTAEEIAQKGFGGWNGKGPRPKGWVDPHAKADA